MPLKERRWELMEVDEAFGPLDVVVDDAMVKAFAFAVDDLRTWNATDAQGVRIGQPTLLCREARDVIRTAYDIASGGAGMHTKHRCVIHDCPRVGERVRITGRHTDKYVKRDKQTIVLASEVRGEDGRTLLSQASTHIRALRPGVAKPVPAASALPASPAAAVASAPVAVDARALRPGELLPPLVKQPTPEQLAVFAGMEWRNIHNDRDVAHAAGLPACIASGLQTLAYVSQLLEGVLGEGWRRGGTLDVAFTAPLLAHQSVHVFARVADIPDPDASRLAFDVWCDTPDGVRVLAGRAGGRLVAGAVDERTTDHR
jgi:acyl dehydratase